MSAHDHQTDLFMTTDGAGDSSAAAVSEGDQLVDALRALDPDAMSPRDALDAVYALKKLLS